MAQPKMYDVVFNVQLDKFTKTHINRNKIPVRTLKAAQYDIEKILWQKTNPK